MQPLPLDPINEKEIEFFATKMLQENIISADLEIMLKGKVNFFFIKQNAKKSFWRESKIIWM